MSVVGLPRGPLAGIRVVEFAGIGPGPMAAMLLSDMGAEVIRIEPPQRDPQLLFDVTARGRVSLSLDLKREGDLARCLEALRLADVLIEGFRPGVMERLGLGPEIVLQHNPRLIYGRMTGWGQEGPRAKDAGHDINYIAMTGALAAMGESGQPPRPPLNLVGDFGGGALYLVFGIAAALYERERSGRGQIVDAAIVDGTNSLMAVFQGLAASMPGVMERERMPLGGVLPNYRCYRCADQRYVAVGAIEPHFHRELLRRLGLGEDLPCTSEEAADEAGRLERVFATRTRDEWAELFVGTDACVSPVLELHEAHADPHMAARSSHVTIDGVPHPVPAPRFSRTPGTIQGVAPAPDEGGEDRLAQWRGAPRRDRVGSA